MVRPARSALSVFSDWNSQLHCTSVCCGTHPRVLMRACGSAVALILGRSRR